MSTLILEAPTSRAARAILTLRRARLYALLSLVLGSFLVISAFVANPDRLTAKVDFLAFYNAGRILNEHPHGALYNQELQLKLYREAAPTVPDGATLFFVYTPFFAFIFSPLAVLPYPMAFITWIVISLGLFGAGFALVWNSSQLPRRLFLSGILIALSFLPFFAWCVLAGQTTAFGFFFLALAVYLDRQDCAFLSGVALAMLLYKPPLLLLMLPMLVITKRWRTLAGFSVTSVALAAISLVAIGFSGIQAYREMLERFSVLKVTGRKTTGQEVDALSFFLALTGNHKVAIGLFVALSMISVPLLVRVWRQRSDQPWAIAITWTVVLNVYVLLYDATFLIIPVVLMAGAAVRNNGTLPAGLRWLLLALFVVPWFETNLAAKGFLPFTAVVVALGCYQLFYVQELADAVSFRSSPADQKNKYVDCASSR